MNLKVYTKRRYSAEDASNGGVNTKMMETASSFYEQLEKACSDSLPLKWRYDLVRQVFSHAVDQSVLNCQMEFVGFFSKVDYCIKEYNIPFTIANLIQSTRKELFPSRNKKRETTNESLLSDFPHYLKATTLLVYYICGKEDIPATLKDCFPKADKRSTWGKFDEKVMRVITERWDDKYIWAREEENNTTVQICYCEENTYLTREGNGTWEYLKDILWEGAQLNLVQIRKTERGDIILPELIILEPDYLINITTIAGCFETYAESPFVNLIKKLSPAQNTLPIHIGNLAGQFLDDTVHGRNVSMEESLQQYVSKNALSMISCKEVIVNYPKFKEEAQIQKRNIEKLIGHDLNTGINGYDTRNVVLEPAFFSEVLGIQGRFDFLHVNGDDITIIEQKSGKGDFVPYSAAGFDPNIPKEKETHTVQALLYRAIYQYELQRYADDVNVMLLYSKYSQGLLKLPPMPSLFLRAIKMRNLLAWSEYYYAKEGMDILLTLTPEKLNQKKITGRLWEEYVRPQLESILTPIQQSSHLERLYFLRFLRFLENEQLLSKVGNKQKENSGFATIWQDTLEDKKAAGNIYDNLIIDSFGYEEENETSVESVTLRFQEKDIADTSNFRSGDIVILYRYRKGDSPNACADMVVRASIVDIREDKVELRLRNSQTDRRVFEDESGETLWAVEHDMYESMTGGLYSAMHSFLSATKGRKQLLLSQRMPEVDETRTLKGDYGSFNTLSLRAKQAKDMFLIIGPPGTGKTSFGLVNLLKEELLEEGTNVLLLSYTNRAVDEICSKLVEIKKENSQFDFIRIGSDLSCAKEYRDFLLSSRSTMVKGGNGVNRLIKETRVFCGTTSAINANMSLLMLKRFSLAIIDESSQILEPHLIGLLSANENGENAIEKIVLIGDHKQLPAVVQQPQEDSVVEERELNEIGLYDCRLSLFERLLTRFHSDGKYDERFVYMLTKQGRMHQDIARFPSRSFYSSKLDIVPLKHQTLPCQRIEGNGIKEMLTTRRITFVASERPEMSPSAKTNMVEARMVAATVRSIYELTRETFEVDRTIGVIVPYRNQISTIRNEIDKAGIPELHNITIDTVERYQGSQRDYIIYAFTVHQRYQLNFLTNNVFEEDGMTIDRKLNVAMTRARLNLIMIGYPALLEMNSTFCELMEYTRSNGGYVDVGEIRYCNGDFEM